MSKQTLTKTVKMLVKYKSKFALLVTLAVMTTGCASIMNPYEENFACRANPSGKCVSINSAYEQSTGDRIAPTRPVEDSSSSKNDATQSVKTEGAAPTTQSLKDMCKGDSDCLAKTVASRAKSEAEASYQVASQNKMARMLKEPVTPLVAPPTVLRVLILPYQDEESGLNLMRYTYIMVDKPKWIMGDYLNEGVNVQ